MPLLTLVTWCMSPINSPRKCGKRKIADCTNKDIPTVEARQESVAFYHNEGSDLLKPGWTLPNLANICLHKSTFAQCFLFSDSDKNFLEKVHENMVGGPSTWFTRKAVLDDVLIRKSSNVCKSIARINANQLHPYSMCQPCV